MKSSSSSDLASDSISYDGFMQIKQANYLVYINTEDTDWVGCSVIPAGSNCDTSWFAAAIESDGTVHSIW